MTNLPTPKPLPHTISDALECLLLILTQAQKDDIAGIPESDLIDLHFGLGIRIRREFGLWEKANPDLLLDCQRIRFPGRFGMPERLIVIHPDDASMVIIRALWERLRH